MKSNIVNFSNLELTKTLNARLFVEEEINKIINEPDSLNKNKKIMEKFENYPQRFEETRTKLYLIYSLKFKNSISLFIICICSFIFLNSSVI